MFWKWSRRSNYTQRAYNTHDAEINNENRNTNYATSKSEVAANQIWIENPSIYYFTNIRINLDKIE